MKIECTSQELIELILGPNVEEADINILKEEMAKVLDTSMEIK